MLLDDWMYFLLDRMDAYGYEDLFEYLYDTPFVSKVQLDDNMITDCLYLRGKMGYISTKPASVLEVLVCLATDIDNVMRDDENNRIEQWFWMMLHNMALDIYSNDNFIKSEVEKTVNKFIERKYSHNGVGGPFPVTNPKKDMRKVALFYQMNWYVAENFNYEF